MNIGNYLQALNLVNDGFETLQNKIITDFSNSFNNQFETSIIEGLKLKGFEFQNKKELESFIEQNCRCEDNFGIKQRIYYVFDQPFFLHDYNIEMELTQTIEDRSISANYGSFAYL